jgi:repressor LexA
MNIIKDLRKIHDISQNDLAEKLNISQQTVSSYENGTREPDISTLKQLALIFNVSIDYLVGHINKEYKIPILGTIRAGLPLLAEDNWEGQIEVPSNFKADFALRITGDSMSWVGIHEGDIAILRQTSTAQHGQIVAAGVNEGDWSATLKFYCQENGTPVLRAANPAYSDIKVNGVHKIIGTLVSIQKDSPSLNTYKNFLHDKESLESEWNETIERAVSLGLDAKQVRSYLDMLNSMIKKNS